jgi:hypothetical protein
MRFRLWLKLRVKILMRRLPKYTYGKLSLATFQRKRAYQNASTAHELLLLVCIDAIGFLGPAYLLFLFKGIVLRD